MSTLQDLRLIKIENYFNFLVDFNEKTKNKELINTRSMLNKHRVSAKVFQVLKEKQIIDKTSKETYVWTTPVTPNRQMAGAVFYEVHPEQKNIVIAEKPDIYLLALKNLRSLCLSKTYIIKNIFCAENRVSSHFFDVLEENKIITLSKTEKKQCLFRWTYSYPDKLTSLKIQDLVKSEYSKVKDIKLEAPKTTKNEKVQLNEVVKDSQQIITANQNKNTKENVDKATEKPRQKEEYIINFLWGLLSIRKTVK